MMGFKWAGMLAGTLAAALVTLSNILLVLAHQRVPPLVNGFGLTTVAIGFLIAFAAHLVHQINARIEVAAEQLEDRLAELEQRVGDHNTGFVEGYLYGHAPGRDAAVVPMGARRHDVQAPYRR